MLNAGDNAKNALVESLNGTLADHFALYMKTKNFHWHVEGPQFRSLHELFDEHASEILGVTDDMAERVRKIGGKTLTSIGSVSAATKVADQDDTDLDATSMVRELRDDNNALVERIRTTKKAAEDAGDNATDGLTDDWTDMAEERAWFLNSLLQ